MTAESAFLGAAECFCGVAPILARVERTVLSLMVSGSVRREATVAGADGAGAGKSHNKIFALR